MKHTNTLCRQNALLLYLKVGGKVKLSRNRPWRNIGVFPGRYEYHFHIKSKAISNRPWRPIEAFPVRYEHHLHIKK
jgi:hypothetical protein